MSFMQSITSSFNSTFKKDENNTEALREMRKNLKSNRTSIVSSRKSMASSRISRQSERQMSNFEIEDFFDQELDEQDAEMAELLKEVQKITLSNIVQKHKIKKLKEEFGVETPIPPSVSQDELTPVDSELSFSIIRLSRGPSSRGSLRGGENPFADNTCIKKNFVAYIKKVV